MFEFLLDRRGLPPVAKKTTHLLQSEVNQVPQIVENPDTARFTPIKVCTLFNRPLIKIL